LSAGFVSDLTIQFLIDRKLLLNPRKVECVQSGAQLFNNDNVSELCWWSRSIP
jgi:hypothetical protein